MVHIKQPKKLTRDQKEIVDNHGLPVNDYMFLEYLEGGTYLKVWNKKTGKIKIVDKYRKKAR